MVHGLLMHRLESLSYQLIMGFGRGCGGGVRASYEKALSPLPQIIAVLLPSPHRRRQRGRGVMGKNAGKAAQLLGGDTKQVLAENHAGVQSPGLHGDIRPQ